MTIKHKSYPVLMMMPFVFGVHHHHMVVGFTTTFAISAYQH